MLITRV